MGYLAASGYDDRRTDIDAAFNVSLNARIKPFDCDRVEAIFVYFHIKSPVTLTASTCMYF
jgi:hypothetical protein